MSGIENIQFAHAYVFHKVGCVKMQEHFVNIANVSVENIPYVLDLKVTYTLTLLKRGSKSFKIV